MLSLPRVLMSVVPAAVLVVLGVVTVWGDSGILAKRRLRAELTEARAEHAALARENRQLLWELRRMGREPVVTERMAAEELGRAQPDAVLWIFGE